MRLQEFKQELEKNKELIGPILIQLKDGTLVPPYYHITEMGVKIKHSIDCGGTLRTTNHVTLQIWTADDFDHRMTIEKLLEIIEKGEKLIGAVNLDLEIEYQTTTVGIYTLESDPEPLTYILVPKKTNCLAPDKCGLIEERKTTCTKGDDCCRNQSPPPEKCDNPSCCNKQPHPDQQGMATYC